MIKISYKETEKIGSNRKGKIFSLSTRQNIIEKDDVLLDNTESRQKAVSNGSNDKIKGPVAQKTLWLDENHKAMWQPSAP